MASFSALLFVAGHRYPVRQCTYEFTQAVGPRGRVTERVRMGLVQLTLDVPTDDFLPGWAATPNKPLAGQVVFLAAQGGSALETLGWETGQCVGYREEFVAGDQEVGAYSCYLTIAAPKLTLQPGGPLASASAEGAMVVVGEATPRKATDLPTSFRALPTPPDPLLASPLAAQLATGSLTTASVSLPAVGLTPSLASLPAQSLPHMRTGAALGLPPTLDSIRTGEVAMEYHPDYPALVAHLAQRGYPLVVQTQAPHAVFKRVCDKQGTVLREEKYVAVEAGMRFLDLEHEADHVEQLEGTFGGTLPTAKSVLLPTGREVLVENAPDVLQVWQDKVTEYHVRLLEYQRLVTRGASTELLQQHRVGVEGARKDYNDALFKRGPDKKRTAWAKQYFPELPDLIQQYAS